MHANDQPTKFKLGQEIIGEWIGMKVITYNLAGDKGVHIESQIDFPVPDITKPPNNWRKYIEVDDTGQIDSGMIVKPFGALTTVRIDGVWVMDNYRLFTAGKLGRALDKNLDVDPPDFKYTSIREIQV